VTYNLLITRPAARQLAGLPPDIYFELRDRIRSLGADPLPPEAEQVEGKECWRIYRGVHRLIYTFDRAAGTVTVLDVARRSDA
jgi:mRNA-degrading endonuclease RelE of RelBE toxin-antitoxin system